MQLSRSARIRFALQQAAEGLASNWAAIAVVIGLGVLFVVGGNYLSVGPAQVERADVLGFGIYEDYVGTQSIVRVRRADGGISELPAGASSLRNCHQGSRIWLIRRPHNLAVDPRGCSAGKD